MMEIYVFFEIKKENNHQIEDFLMIGFYNCDYNGKKRSSI